MFNYNGNQLIDKRLAFVEALPAEAHRPAEDAAHDGTTSFVARQSAIRDSKRQHAQVVRDHSERGIGYIVELSAVLSAGHLTDGLHDRLKNVGVVIAVLALQDGRDALEAHAGVHMLGR